MLVPLPTYYGMVVTHAVEPGYETLVEEARARYGRAMACTRFIAGLLAGGGAIAGIAITLSLASHDTAESRGVMTFFVVASIVVGVLLFPAAYTLGRAIAQDGIVADVKDHTLQVSTIDHFYQSGKASNEQEWQAAKLIQEARGHDDEQDRLRSEVEGYRLLVLTPEREAEVARLETRIRGLEKRSRKLCADAAELLDPPVPRRSKRPTVVG